MRAEFRQVAMAFEVDHPDFAEVEEKVSHLPMYSRVGDIRTPDCTYRVFHWDDVYWDPNSQQVQDFFALASRVRHAILMAPRDDVSGKIELDILTEDEYGSDQEFEEILGYTLRFTIWQDTDISDYF